MPQQAQRTPLVPRALSTPAPTCINSSNRTNNQRTAPTSNNRARTRQRLGLATGNLLSSSSRRRGSEWLQETTTYKHLLVKLAQACQCVLELLAPLAYQRIVDKGQLALKKASRTEWAEDHTTKEMRSKYHQKAFNNNIFHKQQTPVI